MARKHYIDTSSPDSRFCMPKIGVPYEEWLHKKYNTSSTIMDGRPAFYGVAQKINHLIFEAREYEHQLMAFGKHAKEAAAVINEISQGTVTVEIVK